MAGGSGRVTFFVESQEQGQYSVEIEGRRGEFLTGTFEVSRALDPANLSLSDLVIAPAQVEPFNPVTIRLVASNRGELDGRNELEFRINGVLTELRSVVVPGGSSIDVEFGFEPPRRCFHCRDYRSRGDRGACQRRDYGSGADTTSAALVRGWPHNTIAGPAG